MKGIPVFTLTWLHQISQLQESIKQFNGNVARIGDLHARSLNNTDEQTAARVEQELDALVNDTSDLSNVLKRSIKAHERRGGAGRDGQIRKQQVRFASCVVIDR